MIYDYQIEIIVLCGLIIISPFNGITWYNLNAKDYGYHTSTNIMCATPLIDVMRNISTHYYFVGLQTSRADDTDPVKWHTCTSAVPHQMGGASNMQYGSDQCDSKDVCNINKSSWEGNKCRQEDHIK
jgi:hypothetical protein